MYARNSDVFCPETCGDYYTPISGYQHTHTCPVCTGEPAEDGSEHVTVSYVIFPKPWWDI